MGRRGASGATLTQVDPSDGTPLADIARGTAVDIDAAVRAAQAALGGGWGAATATERGRLLLKMSALVLEQADELARLEALDVGNACVLKPAEEACLAALAFTRIAQAAGLAPGALNVVPGLGEEAGAALAAHPGVRHISFTGSAARPPARVTTACRSAGGCWFRWP